MSDTSDSGLALIAKSAYRDDAHLAREIERLFLSGYQFAGLTTELANNRDFICVDFLGCAVVVQNFGGELKAFENVCTHRFNRIQTEVRGNRPLTCGYHGWSFGRDGAPLGGKREQLLRTNVDPSDLCLKRFRVEACGRFVFFAPENVQYGLAEQLGDYWSVLQDISQHIGDETHFGSILHAANWKLLVENVLECYHCAVVHPETFLAGLGVGRKPLEQVAFSGTHSSCHFPRTETKREALRKRLLSHLASRELVHDSFYHIHIFPNLFISSTEGSAFYVGHALPLSAGQTKLRIRFFEANVALTESQRSRQRAINEQSIALGLRVIEEDRAILENVQRGIALTEKPGALNHEEVRIAHFMARYRALMG